MGKSLLMIAAFALGTLVLGSVAFAQSEDGDGTANKARHRLYVGGRDEQDLEVQSGLPLPTRSPEGPTLEAEPGGNDAPTD